MRTFSATLVACLAVLPAASAVARPCFCGDASSVEVGPAEPVAPYAVALPGTIYARTTVLVPRTRYERRVVYVPRTRLVPRTVSVPYTAYGAYPVFGAGYPAGYHYGATYVPPGITYGCTLGAIGCDASAVGPLDE